jgi:hypothetical protein
MLLVLGAIFAASMRLLADRHGHDRRGHGIHISNPTRLQLDLFKHPLLHPDISNIHISNPMLHHPISNPNALLDNRDANSGVGKAGPKVKLQFPDLM